MSRDDNKQVEDALDAIKKLVELSENKLGQDETVLTLDHVVWRNPVSDAPEEIAPPSQSPAPTALAMPTPVPSGVAKPSRPSFVSVSSHDLNETPLTVDNIVSPSARGEDKDKEVARHIRDDNSALSAPQPPQRTASSPTNTAPTAIEMNGDKAEATRQRISLELAQASEDIKELTAPLGRRGGGFYSTPQQDDAAQIAIKTRSESPSELVDSHQLAASDIPTAHAPKMPDNQKPSAQTADQVPEKAAHNAVETGPALTDFQGADFNFSVAEGLMTAADFESLEQIIPEIKPQIEVPIAPPAVANPVDEVHQRLQQAQQGTEDPTSDMASEMSDELISTPSGQPNLHVVSDQAAFENEDEDDGFSGDVRLALRALIKEQVSTWLQGNMTGLIEEALSTPNKRGAKNSKPKTTKR